MDTIEGQVTDSNVVATETPVTQETKTTTEGTTQTAAQVQEPTQNDITTVDVSKLAPELQAVVKNFQADYTRKTQALAQERKRLGEMEQYKQAIEQLIANPKFVEWYNAQQQPAKPAELSDEEYQSALLDKAKFAELVRKEAQTLFESKYGPQVNSLQETLLTQQYNQELDKLEQKYPDFKEIEKSGGLDAYVEAGKDYETAYALFKLHNGQKEVVQKAVEVANGIVNKKKLSSVEKPGGSIPSGKKVIKARDFSEAFDKAFAAKERNEEVLVERA